MRSLALFLPNWIGDVVMATPAIRALRARYPQARLVAVCRPYVAETVNGSAWFEDTISLPRAGFWTAEFWRTLGQLRSAKLEAAVLFPNSFRVAVLAQAAGCRQVVGFARYGRDALLTTRLYPRRGPSGRPKPSPVIDDYNRLALAFETPDPGHRMELFTTATDEAAADSIWQRFQLHRFQRVVGLNPGGAFGAAKHWPTTHFAELARQLAERERAGVLILCGPAEREIARQIATLANHPNIYSLSDSALSLGLTKAVVRRLQLLITTDSGPRHFAPAFGVPVVTLYGPTFIEWTRTYFADEISLQKKLPCGPCQQRVCPLGHHRCMTELQPAEVLIAAESLLVKSQSTRGEIKHAS